MSSADQVLNVVGAYPEGVALRTVAAALGVSSNLVSANLTRLRKAGKVERVGEGVWRIPAPPPPEPRPSIATPAPMSATVIEARREFRAETRRRFHAKRATAALQHALQRWQEKRP